MHRKTILVIGILICLTSPGWSLTHAAIADSFEQLMLRLPGHWRGQALETPVGRMNYDMLFHNCEDGSIAGVAATGASLHYWKFLSEGQTPRIQFLSTFRGNRSPQFLSLSKTEGSTLSFYAPDLRMLTLDLTLMPSTIDFRVFHHGQPHVHIRLSRIVETFTPAPHHSRNNSCRGQPTEQ